MKKATISITLILGVVALTALIFDFGRKEATAPEINTESLITTNSNTDMPVVLSNIKENQLISSPLNIKGKARGFWFFEASFPVKLVDADENVLASSIATAEGEWMTEDFVDFTASLDYTKPTSTSRALLILSKDNPSGDPKFDQSIFIPVMLK